MYTIIKMSITASLLALFLLPGKLLLQKAGIPKRITLFLWLIIAFRLICPITIESNLSVLNFSPQNNLTIEQSIDAITTTSIAATTNQHSSILPVIYNAGTAIFLGYAFVCCIILKRKLRFAVRLQENVYISDSIPNSFVFGLLKPKIYINDGYSKETLSCVILHEQTHINRLDHITKLLAFLILAVHWFNPIVWLMFFLFSQDIELACDEAAVRNANTERKVYLDALLAAAIHQPCSLLFKVCFASSSAKKRITNILKLKKHSKTLSYIGAFICLAASVTFCTNSMPNFIHSSIEKPYSYKSNLHDKIYSFYCKENGEIDIHFNVNGEHIVNLTVSDSKTGEIIEDAGILAGKNTTYTVPELIPGHAYDIELQGTTKNTWKIEGSFIID